MERYDIIIAGAGASGVFMAYELTKLGCGAKVLMVDKGAPLEKRQCPIKKGLDAYMRQMQSVPYNERIRRGRNSFPTESTI